MSIKRYALKCNHSFNFGNRCRWIASFAPLSLSPRRQRSPCAPIGSRVDPEAWWKMTRVLRIPVCILVTAPITLSWHTTNYTTVAVAIANRLRKTPFNEAVSFIFRRLRLLSRALRNLKTIMPIRKMLGLKIGMNLSYIHRLPIQIL